MQNIWVFFDVLWRWETSQAHFCRKTIKLYFIQVDRRLLWRHICITSVCTTEIKNRNTKQVFERELKITCSTLSKTQLYQVQECAFFLRSSTHCILQDDIWRKIIFLGRTIRHWKNCLPQENFLKGILCRIFDGEDKSGLELVCLVWTGRCQSLAACFKYQPFNYKCNIP